MKQPSLTLLVECKNKPDCKIALKRLEKKRGRYIRAIHETVPWYKEEDIKSRLRKFRNVRLGKADYIIEIAANRFSDLEDVKRDFQSNLPETIASLYIK
jgi:hypothetical protein